ncbi:MAG: DmsE family decaheme c-type cytochrome, partial [Gammaproteobacteria bacterium]|nr:DmsE family decaheme c-type cytochrome [Gammaproteobacteria bacterium]
TPLPPPAGRPPTPPHAGGAPPPPRADLQNGLCLQCHADYGRARWAGSAHEQADLACADCHRVHDAIDPVRHPSAQNRTCTACHRDVAADALKLSAHPLRDSQLICRDCHDPHGTDSDRLNLAASASETCIGCHAEKRGPFLWEHPPVVEDCMNCHVPHGANQPALLVRRPPQLCQGCHSSVGHRSLAQDANDLPPRPASVFLVANACLNCHSEVHGSNHPSGNWFRR